jgi:beta-lactamase regulating signal transducer with metallopeptidase domain
MQEMIRSIGQSISSERLGWELGWTMVYFLVTGGLLWAFAALLRRAMRSFSAQSRYAAALVCLVLLVGLAPACFWAVRKYPEDLMLVAPRSRVVAMDAVGEAIGMKSPFAGPSAQAVARVSPGRRLEAAWMEFRAALFDERLAPLVSVIVPKLPWIWLVGSSLMLIYFSCGLMGVDRLRRECDALDQEELGGLLRRLCREMRVSRRVAIGMSDRIAAPLVVGVLRPMILLPMSVVSSLSVDQLEFVLLHELAHVRRHDNFVNLLQRFVEAIAFFHPAAWRISAWVRLERELCCDAAVLRRRANPNGYAETLASLAMPGLSAPYAVASLANHQLVSRVRHIMSVQEPSMRFSSKWFVATAMALLISGGFVAAFAQTPEKTETKNPDEKPEAGQTFSIEVQVGKDGVLSLNATPESSYSSVAKLLQDLARSLEKQGKHPEIKVKAYGQEKSWITWTKENCASCHQDAMPQKTDISGAAVQFKFNEACEPGLAKWIELAVEPQQDTAVTSSAQGLFHAIQLRDNVTLDPARVASIDLMNDVTVQFAPAAWSVEQAMGPPNTFVLGDVNTAWASKTPDGQGEWLLLTYEAPVDVSAVLIHETFNPGAVARVDAILPDNAVVVLWSGEPKAVSTDSPRLFLCKPKTAVKTAKIRVTIASDLVAGWNEIDAVGILDAGGKVHWAKEATASSSYSDGSTPVRQGSLLQGLATDHVNRAEGITTLLQEVTAAPRSTSQVAVDWLTKSQPQEAANQQLGLTVKSLSGSVEESKPKEPLKVEVFSEAKPEHGDQLLWRRIAKGRKSDSDKLKEIEAEFELLQKQLDALRAKMKSND